MPYKVEVHIAKAYAAITVKDWLSDSPCVDTTTKKKIEDYPVNPSATFNVLIGQQDGIGGVIIYETVLGATPVPSNYEIPTDLDDTGKITFPKPKTALQSDLDNLDAKVNTLAQHIEGNKRGK
ncbi:hypothetical protein CPT32_08085 [Rhizobium sophoriradicis]|uniref:hypothetical protein n=1 Tax=Rhizobium sophoriradicis TaxID=1535245 RepID=UPI000BBDE705|nr:hypothetical protein [Rhizobium sophoriradicis]PCK87542.1 hypothetical protein CPT32_08085 [Rhizobium sophoriradicis]